MKILRHIDDVPADVHGAVYAVGNFDGVHKGHQALVAQTKSLAASLGAPSGVLTFEPHTLRVIRPNLPPFRLTPLRAKAHLLEDVGIEVLAALPFDLDIAKMAPDAFIKDLLVDGLHAGHLIVGYDFCFGKNRAGNAELLREAGKEYGFGVSVVDAVTVDNSPYSSTRIRKKLQEGQVREAAGLLGHWWQVDGRIMPGQQIGRTIGFPTANLHLGDYLEPLAGVYAVEVSIDEDQPELNRPGVAYFGHRPTVDGKSFLLEVFLFDFDGDLYGKHLRVSFIDFVRGDENFPTLDALKEQIARDCDSARRILDDPSTRIIPEID